MTKQTIAVLMGGPSSERDISMKSGQFVVASLDKEKYNILPVEIRKDGNWILPSGVLDQDFAIQSLRSEYHVDVVFLALHGKFGEDGTVQKLLDDAKISYTGSGAQASALAMDKEKANAAFLKAQLSVPKGIVVSQDDIQQSQIVITSVEHSIGFPCVVKPARGGSSYGVSLVDRPEQLAGACSKAFTEDSRILIQEKIEGDEVTCAVFDDGEDGPRALLSVQIVPATSSFFDLEAKYSDGGAEEVSPPRLSAEIVHAIEEAAMKAHTVLGCAGLTRTDMIVSRGVPFVLETNTIPGMTATSLIPRCLASAGMTFPELLDAMIDAALHTD